MRCTGVLGRRHRACRERRVWCAVDSVRRSLSQRPSYGGRPPTHASLMSMYYFSIVATTNNVEIGVRMAWNWRTNKLDGTDPRLKEVFWDAHARSVYKQLSLPRASESSYFDELRDSLNFYVEHLDGARKRKVPGIGSYLVNFSSDLRTRILDILDVYHSGLPSESFRRFETMMLKLIKAGRVPRTGQTGPKETANSLFRIRGADMKTSYRPRDIFHVPTNLRHKISSMRYSIAGYPSLYLTDSLLLAHHETNSPNPMIASHFVKRRSVLLDFGIRPDDFDFVGRGNARVSNDFIMNYLYWFPLLLACSFIRKYPTDPFSDEYVIPQMVMEWLRKQNSPDGTGDHDGDPVPAPPGDGGPFSPKTPDGPDEIGDLENCIGRLGSLTKELLDAIKNPRNTIRAPRNSRQLLDDLIAQIVSCSENASTLMFRFAATQYAMSPSGEEPLAESIENLIKEFSNALDNLNKWPLKSPRPEELERDRDALPLRLNQQRLLASARHYLRTGISYLKWVLSDERIRIVGIRYFSCKSYTDASLGRNYAFPAELVVDHSLPNGMEPYSNDLASLFEWTWPHLFPGDFGTASPADRNRFKSQILSDILIPGKDALKI